jgi:serine/threonine protein kinase
MNVFACLSSVALRGVAEALGAAGIAEGADAATRVVAGRFMDNSLKLTRALTRANERAWRALEIALAGESWWDRCKGMLASADARALRDQVRAFIASAPLPEFHGSALLLRRQCLEQLQAARKAGALKSGDLDLKQLARRSVDLQRFADPGSRLDATFHILGEAGTILRQAGYPALAQFLDLRPANGEPLLVIAARFFFRREIETDDELFQGLMVARVEQIAQGQQAGFSGLAEALDEHGDRLEWMLSDVQALLGEVHGSVLDVKAELERQGQQMQDLGREVLEALDKHRLSRREVTPGDSLSIRTDVERQLVKRLIGRYRSLPAAERSRLPALLNAVGKLEVAAGDFDAAQRDFQELTALLPDQSSKAEALHNTYQAALERRAWPEALAALREAATLDPERFAPFPLSKFEPERILGAGGFGVAFLCRNRHSGSRVVVKSLRRDSLDRDLGEVFREAQVLEEVSHVAVIRVRDCDYADAARTRPYLVMDFFEGQTLAEYVDKNGPIVAELLLPLARLVAEGMQQAHARGILHRDIKPANLLVRRTTPSLSGSGSGNQAPWEVRLIDFGLALRHDTLKASTSRSRSDRTLSGESIAGTLDYAAPEQMGKLHGVPVSPASDVYCFGKTCCFALFGTPQPTFQHWQRVRPVLAELIGRCLSEKPQERPANFGAVVEALDRVTAPPKSAAPPKPAAPRPPAIPIPSATPVPVPPALPVPVPPAPPLRTVVRDAEPIDALPADLPPRREPSRRERDEPRRLRDRDRDWDRDEPRREPARRTARKTWLVILIVVLISAAIIGLTYSGHWSGSSRFPSFGKDLRPIADDEWPRIISDLKSAPADPGWDDTRVNIAARLLKTDVTEANEKYRAAVAKGIEPGLKHHMKSQTVLQALRIWGTKENGPALIEIVNNGFSHIDRGEAMKTLAELNVPGGEAAIGARLDDSWTRPAAIEALKTYGRSPGSKAESVALKYLQKIGDNEVRKAACQILGDIGTDASKADLKKLTDDPKVDKGLAGEAEKALFGIELRYPPKG